MSWPSGSKAGTTNCDNANDSISDARSDILQNITNVNTIIDFYDATGPYATKGEYSKQQYFDMTTLTATDDSSGGIAWDLGANQVAQLTLAASSTLANPTNIEAGATYVLIVKQDGTGNRTLAYDSKYKFPNGNAPTLSTGANDVDVLCFVSDGTNLYGNAMLDMS